MNEPFPERDDPLAEGERRRERGDLVGAEAAFREALARAPDDPDALFGLASVLADQDRFDAALRVLDVAVARIPDEWERRERLRADIYGRSGRPEAAIALLREIVARDPTARAAWHDLAFALLATAEPEAADRALGRALEKLPHDATLWGTRGAVAAANGRPADAVRCYAQALACAKDLPKEKQITIATHLANALDMAGETERAIAAYRAIIAEHEDARLAWLQLGMTLWRVSRYREAAIVLADAIARWPGEHHAYYYLADSERMVGRNLEAERIFQLSCTRWPECPECLYGLAQVKHELGKPEEAALLLRHVLVQRPENADAIGLFADTRFAIGEHDEARELFERAITLAPGEVRHVYNFALREMKAGRLERATALFDRALEIAPHLDRALYFAAVCRLERGLREEALDFLRRFVIEEPRSRAFVRADPKLDRLKTDDKYRELVGGSALDFASPAEASAGLTALAARLPAGGTAAPERRGRPLEQAVAEALAAAGRARAAHGEVGPPPRFYFETRVEGPSLTIAERDARDPAAEPRPVARLERLADGTFLVAAA